MLEVRALAKATEALRQAQDIRAGKPAAVIVLSMVGRNYRLTQDMKDAAAALDLPLAKTAMILRQIYADAPGQGAVVGSLGARAKELPQARWTNSSANCCPLPFAARQSRPVRSAALPLLEEEVTMTNRRSLTEGLQQAPTVDPQVEEAFVFKRPPPEARDEPPVPPVHPAKGPTLSRAPLSTRIRADMAAALKRASLETPAPGRAAQHAARHPGRGHRAVAPVAWLPAVAGQAAKGAAKANCRGSK